MIISIYIIGVLIWGAAFSAFAEWFSTYGASNPNWVDSDSRRKYVREGMFLGWVSSLIWPALAPLAVGTGLSYWSATTCRKWLNKREALQK